MSKWIQTWVWIAALAGIGAWLSGCGGEAPRLTIAQRRTADSLYHESAQRLAAELDTLCAQKRDSVVLFFVDSLYDVRLAEIERQLKRIRDGQ